MINKFVMNLKEVNSKSACRKSGEQECRKKFKTILNYDKKEAISLIIKLIFGKEFKLADHIAVNL